MIYSTQDLLKPHQSITSLLSRPGWICPMNLWRDNSTRIHIMVRHIHHHKTHSRYSSISWITDITFFPIPFSTYKNTLFCMLLLIVVLVDTLPSTPVLNVSIRLTTVAENGVCSPALILSYVSPP
jgi:ABC-type lipoprotein release transport system permease subunit